jgi:hypothetical protein
MLQGRSHTSPVPAAPCRRPYPLPALGLALLRGLNPAPRWAGAESTSHRGARPTSRKHTQPGLALSSRKPRYSLITLLPDIPAVDKTQEQDEAHFARLSRRVNLLRAAVAQACEEVGCICLARRISQRFEQLGQAVCSTKQAPLDSPAVDMLSMLSPLSGALSSAGYYDTALECANLAQHCEPVLDLELTRAFLHLVLGDTEDASRIYHEAARRHGGIPERAVARVAELMATHSDEEDIAELYAELTTYIKCIS